MDKEVTMTSGPADYITLDDVTRSFITANADAFDNGIYRPQAGKISRFAGGFADAMRETRKLKDSLMIFGGQGAMTVGGFFGEDSALSEWGKEIVRAGSRQIAAIDAENAKKSDMADYEKDTFAYKLGGGFASVVQMLIAGYLTGGAAGAAGAGVKAVQGAQKVGALVAGASQEISSETQEGIQNYRQKTGDEDLQNYTTGEATKEFLSTAGYGAASTALESLNLSRVMPFLKEGKKVIPNFWKGAISEGGTEMLQELANIGFDLVDGTIDFSKMPERLYGMFEQGVIGGLVGGTTAGAFSIKNRAQIKNYLREELAGVVPEKDLNAVVNKLYEDGIDTMAGVVTAELSESESLRNKHGDIYRAMMTAIDKAAAQSGAFADEAARAAYVSETAAMFADQVLAEANFRNVAIDEVLKASDIVFEDGGIKFKTGTQTFDAAGNTLFQTNDISSKIAKLDADRLAFERKNINLELSGRENEIVEPVVIDRKFLEKKSSADISEQDVFDAIDERKDGENENKKRVLRNSRTGETVTLSNGSISKMFHSASDRSGGNIGGILGKECIANIRSIFDSSFLIKTTDDEKHKTGNKIRRYANTIQSGKDFFIVKITVKELAQGRKELTDIEIEKNGGKDLSAYDLKVGRKKKADEGNMSGDASPAVPNGSDINIGDLIDFVNTFTDDTIKINGKERSTKNSAGQRIAKTEEGLRAFYEWFGDSKVTDKDDKPLVVYHGSPNKDIEVFDKSKIGSRDYGYYGEGFYFTPREGVAEAYSGSNESSPFYSEKTEDGKIYPVYLKMENPYFASVYREGEIDTERLKDKGYDGVVVYDYDEYTEEDRETNPYIKEEIEEAKKFKNKMWQLKNYSDEVIGSIQINEVVAFEPEQIKSVENVGSFDAKNPNIYYQSAFAGARVDYDKPSLEAINSGEGAQAHGWGLYYALNKDVAEGYRKKFSKPYTRFISFGEIKYNPETKSYENAFDETTLEFDVYRDFKLNAEGDFDVLIKSYNQTIDFQDTPRRLEIAKKYKDYFINGDVHYFEDESIAKGQVHEVDIPENPYLLDEQKPFSEQSDFVKEKLNELFANIEIPDKVLVNFTGSASNPYKNVAKHKTGREIYKDLAKILHSDKAASEMLSKYGIKGITYEGGRDGRCFVIFDDKDVKVIQKFYQGMVSGGVKGSYSPYNRLLKITEKADYSTLSHEFAHFWLSEMENWVNSGLASEDYLKRYDIAMDWLKAEAGKPLSRRAQEQFARGYEQYLLNGNLPESPMNPLYAEYDKWLKAVYNDLNQPSKKPLTTDMVRFFQSMTTGTLPDTVLPPVNVDRREKKEKDSGLPRPEGARNDENGNGSPRFARDDERSGALVPVAIEAKDGKVSAAAERQNRLNKINGLLKEDPQNVFYEPITLEKSAQQAEMLMERDGADGVRQMIDGERPMPENVIRTAVLIAYEQEMLKQGNTAEYLRVLRKHTLEQTRRGQEISAERINQDVTNPSYWAKQALLGRKNSLADNIFERIRKEGDTKEKAVDRFVSETAAEYAEKLEKAADKDAVIKELNGKIKSITGEQMELFQKESVAGKTYDAVYDEIGRWIEECFDVGISTDEMNVLTEKTMELAAEFQSGLKPGENPSVEAMAKIKEMRETVAAMNPTNWLSLSVNSYGRAAMLSSPKSAVLNILSNAETYVTEAIARRIANGGFEKAVDPKAVGDYLKYDYDVYKASGVMMSVVRPDEILDPARRLLGENVMSSAGEGNFRKGVRFMERLIFDWSLGTPDAKAKALSFVDNAALEATKTAKAEGLTGKALTERATALFKDACLYQPVTADGISIRNNSINAAEVATFTNNGKIAEMSGKVRNLINAATGKVRLGDFVMPFVKTPANVVALGMEYSFGLGTAALHLPQILADVRAGTLSEASRNVIRSSIRNGIGIALAALIASLFDPEDYISSFALASQKERDLVRFKNGVYNSIKIGGKYVSLDYFGPLGAPLVGWFEAKKATGTVEKVAAFLKAAGQQFGNVPGVKELASLTGWIDKAVAQPTEKTLEDLWNGTTDQILARSIPAIVSDIAKIADPFERVSEDGVVGALSAKIPVAREALSAKADMSAGREKASENALSVLLFGARVKTAADNDVAREIRRLSDAGEIPQLSDVARSFKGLTDKGKARARLDFAKGFVNQWGNREEGFSGRVAKLIRTDSYRSKTDAQKKEAINKIRQKMMKELKRKYGGG